MEDLKTQDERPLRVLVVDDNRDAADSLALLFRAWGHDVRVAYDGIEGLQAALDYRPDCLFLDIGMPGMDGYTLANRLRQELGMEGSKLVALTAYSDSHRAKEAGFDYHFVKPANPSIVEGLLNMLKEVVRAAKNAEELAKQNMALASDTKELLKEVKEEIKEVKEKVAVASETKELLQEVKEELKEVKEEVKELKEELREVKEEKPHEAGE